MRQKRVVLNTVIPGRFLLLAPLLLLMYSPPVHSQEVIAGSGGHQSSSAYTLSWTLGEVVIETMSNDNILTQGFHQPDIQIVSVDQKDKAQFEITAFPNPTSSNLTLQVPAEDFLGMQYEVLDSRGRLVGQGKINETKTGISMEALQASTYFIRVFRNNEVIANLTIIKH